MLYKYSWLSLSRIRWDHEKNSRQPKFRLNIAFLFRVESLTVEWHVFLRCSIRIRCNIRIRLKIQNTVFFNFYKQIHNERTTNIYINVRIMVFRATFNNITVLSWRSVLFCLWVATVRWFSSDTPVSFINKTDRHDKTVILLKVARNTMILTLIYMLVVLSVAISFIDEGNRSIWRKPPNCRNSQTNFMLYQVQLAMSGIRTHNFSCDRYWLYM
jgi:hypothetical protein